MIRQQKSEVQGIVFFILHLKLTMLFCAVKNSLKLNNGKGKE